jgi:hypothetical protein
MKMLPLLLVLVCLAGTASACLLQPALAGTPTPEWTVTATITQTVVWFQPSATPSPVPTPQEVTATPPALLPGGEVLLRDDFSDQRPWLSGAMQSGNIAFGNQELVLAVAVPKGSLTSLREQPVLDNFLLEITAGPDLCQGKDQYGILFWVQSLQDFYRLLLTCEGYLRLERLRSGQGSVLQDWIPSAQVQPGAPGSFRVSIWTEKREVRVYVEGVLQFTWNEPEPSSGQVGVYARSMGDNPLTVSFSALEIRRTTP